jgi:chaperonin GroEL (HSP60 family)
VSNIAIVSAIAEMLESNFGPTGRKKLILTYDPAGWVPTSLDGTSDGSLILEKVEFKHPVGKIVAEMTKAIDKEVGDGAKTAIIVAGKLLEKAKHLMDEGIHPTTIISGYEKARRFAVQTLDKLSMKIDPNDAEAMSMVSATSMGCRIPWEAQGHLSKISVRAADCVRKRGNGDDLDVDDVKIVKREGKSLLESRLIEGCVVPNPMFQSDTPRKVTNARIAMVARSLEAVSMGEYSTRGEGVTVNISKPSQMKAFVDVEKTIVNRLMDKILAMGANVVLCRLGIEDFAMTSFSRKGVLACKRVLTPDLSQIEKATGGHIVWDVDKMSQDDLGVADLVTIEKMVGDEHLVISGCRATGTASIIVRGGTTCGADEAERAIRDGLHALRAVLRNPEILPGGGAVEAELAFRISEYSAGISSREQLAVKAFSESIDAIPALIAKNCGMDPIDTQLELRRRHAKGEHWIGIDARNRSICDVRSLGICDPKTVKLQAINSAYEIAKTMLRVDRFVQGKIRTERKHEPLKPEDIEKWERKMLPKVAEVTKPEHKERWQKSLGH